MATEKIMRCDICGAERSDLKQWHWTDRIHAITLSLKDHPFVQSIPFEGDACAGCAKGLCDMISSFVAGRQPASPAPSNGETGR